MFLEMIRWFRCVSFSTISMWIHWWNHDLNCCHIFVTFDCAILVDDVFGISIYSLINWARALKCWWDTARTSLIADVIYYISRGERSMENEYSRIPGWLLPRFDRGRFTIPGLFTSITSNIHSCWDEPEGKLGMLF